MGQTLSEGRPEPFLRCVTTSDISTKCSQNAESFCVREGSVAGKNGENLEFKCSLYSSIQNSLKYTAT
jgi:hypothetical protein